MGGGGGKKGMDTALERVATPKKKGKGLLLLF